MKNGWAKVAGLLGIAYCIAGFVLIFLGWNGTASNDDVPAQMPYLISGGIAGLALVVLGAGLLVANSLRTDRVELRAAIDELRGAVERAPAAGAGAPAAGRLAGTANADSEIVLAGSASYHRPGCSVIEGQTDLVSKSSDEAVAAGLTPCRICTPDTA
jgi:hypothetical protein